MGGVKMDGEDGVDVDLEALGMKGEDGMSERASASGLETCSGGSGRRRKGLFVELRRMTNRQRRQSG